MKISALFRRASAGEVSAQELEEVEVPSFPTNVTRLLGLLRDDEATPERIAEVLQHDPGLHVRVLRTVNSAAYGLSSKVESVPRAITLLGRSRLEAIVLAVAVKDTLPRSTPPEFNTDRFWLTCARRASLARALTGVMKSKTAPECFTAGLLQDVGVAVLAATQGEKYVEVYEHWRREPTADLLELERAAFGSDHQEVGGAVAKHWELPEYLGRAIEHHHDDAAEGVNAAVKLVSRLRDHFQDDGVDELLESCPRFDLDPQEVEPIIAGAFARADEFTRGLT